MKKVGQVGHLGRSESAGGSPALRLMALLQKWADRIPVAVVQNGQGAHKVGTVALPPRSWPVASDAFRYIDGFAAFGRLGVHNMLVVGALGESASSSRWRGSRRSCLRTHVGRQVVQNLGKLCGRAFCS